MTQRLFAYVDSAEEQLAFLLSRLGPQSTWRVTEQRMATDPGGESIERTRLETSTGSVEVEFRDAHPVLNFTDSNDGEERTGTLDPCLLYTSPSPRDGLLSRM